MVKSQLFAVVIVLTAFSARANAIPMVGQPVPTPTVARSAARFAADIVADRGDPASSRPALLQLIDDNSAADLQEKFSNALRDENTFTAITATYQDAYDAATDDRTKTYIHYNLLRTLIGRATLLPTLERRAMLARATKLGEELAAANRGDAGVWEATGDLYALRDQTDDAVAAYHRIANSTGGSPELAQIKIAQAYQRIRRYDASKQAYEAGIRADASEVASGGMEHRHLLYQGLASLYLAEGHDPDAVDALLLSSHVRQDPDSPYTLRLEIAYTLLHRGFAKQVRDYADAALKLAPDDDGAKRLRDAADAASSG